MSIGLTIDICACILLIVLTISHFQNKLWTAPDRVFFILLLLCIVSAVTGCISSFSDVTHTVPNILLPINSGLYFLTRSSAPFVYVCYIITLVDGWYTIRSSKLYLFAITVPSAIALLLILTTPWTNGVFYFDSSYMYHRGPLLIPLYMIASYYLFLSILFVRKYHEVLSKKKRLAFYFFPPISIFTVLIQYYYSSLTIEMFATTICLMLVMFTIQRPEELLDGSTGLWNASAFMRDIHRHFYNHIEFTAICINISNLKILNETIGWMAVSDIMNDVSRYIKHLRGSSDGLYSLGGGVFCITLLRRNRSESEWIANEVNKKFCHTWPYHTLELNLLTHITVLHCPVDISDKDLLLKFAHDFDKKSVVTGKVLHFSDFDNQRVHHKKELKSIIENALAEKRFEVYYQPIYSIKEETFSSAEALVRLYDDQYGFIPPDEFIPVAEENMSILRIGRFVLETVCEFIASGKLKDLGIKYIEVNLSVVQCMQTDMAVQILDIVNSYGIEPHQINLEITETATLYSPETMLRNMQILNQNGIHFSLDDYGSGYATLGYLLNFPFSLIKLDKGIICAHDADPQKWIALKHTMEMLLEMGYEIVAEGTETKKIVDDLSDRGCHYLQGYYFSKAIPAAAFVEYITRHNLKF